MEDLQVAVMSAQLAERIGRRRFDLWFKSEAQLSVEATCLTIRAASQFVLEWLRRHLGGGIWGCWAGVWGRVFGLVGKGLLGGCVRLCLMLGRFARRRGRPGRQVRRRLCTMGERRR